LLIAIGGVVLLLGAAYAVVSLARGGSAPATVERSSLVTDMVTRGNLQRSVSASGSFAPENVRVVAAAQPGIVESVFVKPGTVVREGEPIARLSNPDLDADVVGASSALDVARADFRTSVEEAASNSLSIRSTYANARAQSAEDAANIDSVRSLHHDGYVADVTFRVAAIKADESLEQMKVARSQIDVADAEDSAKIEAARAQVDAAAAVLRAKQTEVDALVVRARSAGVVQSVAIDPGARVEAGTELARIADERDLKAVLQVAEGAVHDVEPGMAATIDTGDGTIRGRVARVAPTAQNGSVAVDVSFYAPLPAGARPDLSVQGTIEIEAMRDVLSIARPAGAADDSSVNLYRIDPATSLAHLIRVSLGRGSTDRVVVLAGLSPGDVVIVSDMSAQAGASTLRLR
jgi:HlyD family secretion protein